MEKNENNKRNGSNPIIIQGNFDSVERVTSKNDAFDFIEGQLKNLLALMPHLKAFENGGNEKKNDVLLTVAEACEIVKLSKPFLYDMINSDELPCLEIGKRKQKRIWRSDLEKIGTRRGNTE